ncbi:MAG: hypothetical protein ACK56I_33010, partial [bacterium]
TKDTTVQHGLQREVRRHCACRYAHRAPICHVESFALPVHRRKAAIPHLDCVVVEAGCCQSRGHFVRRTWVALQRVSHRTAVQSIADASPVAKRMKPYPTR